MQGCSYLCDPNDSIKGSSYPMNQQRTEIQPRDELIILHVAEEQNFPAIGCATCIEDYSHLSESEDSIKVLSYPMHQGSLKIQPRDLMVGDSFSLSTKPSLNDKPNIDFMDALMSVDDRDLTDAKTSLPLSSIEGDMEVVRSVNNRPSLNDKPKIDFVEEFKSVDDRYFTNGKSSLSLSSTEEDTKFVHSLHYDKRKIDFGKALKSTDDRYFTDGKTSLPLSSTEEDMELVRSINNFLTARCNHLLRPAIPIGPRFPAKIPKWEGGTNIKLDNDDDDLKWVGTQI